MRCLYREKVYECGDYMEVSIYPAYRKANQRSRRAKPTPEVMKKVNEIHAESKFIRILNANFTEEDLKIELTYDNAHLPADEEAIARELTNFLRRLKHYRKKHFLPELKYVAVTERGKRSGRIHHHLVINGGVELKELVRLWGRGYVHTDPLQFGTNGLTNLGKYMMKCSQVFRKKWNESKNLIHPTAKVRDGRISKRDVIEMARDTENAREFEKHFKGYYLSDARKVMNEYNGGVYIYATFYKKEENDAIRTHFKRKP